MHIFGLQKTTLLDFPGKVACTVFLGGCNFHCPFCHNSSLISGGERPDEIPVDDFFSFLRKRIGILDGVCVTGGEPFCTPDLESFLREIKSMGFSVKLDTNGSFPERLEKVIADGLADYVAMDIKSSRKNYGKAVGLMKYDTSDVEKSVAVLMMGKIPYEFRTTVVNGIHDPVDFYDIATWLAGAEQYFLQAFVSSDGVLCDGLSAFSKDTMEEFASTVRKTVKNVSVRGM